MASSNVISNTKMVKPYISLETPILPNEKLYPTPSMKDNLLYEDEFDLRLTGCELIQTSGRLLKLPQTAMATGQILFHRYYYCKSFVKNNMEYYAMASIYLSSKIEESPRSIRDVINVFSNIKQVRSGKPPKPVPIDHAYYDLKNQVIKAERRILKELGFCVHVKHPHKVILIYLTAMGCNNDKSLIQKAWNYMNDSLRTDVFLRYTPETVACACIYLSARELKIPLPTNPQWFTIFGADENALKSISIRLLHLYSHTPKTQEELEKIVNTCRDNLNQEKVRIKEASQAHLQSLVYEDTKDSTPTTSIIVNEIKTASTTPSSDIAVVTSITATTSTTTTTITTSVQASSSSQVVKPTIINANINITNNSHQHNNYYSSNNSNNHHPYQHHHQNHHGNPHASHYQQQYQHQHYQYQGYHGQPYRNYPVENYYDMEMEPFYRYGDTMNGVKRKDVDRRSSSKSHKKHSKRHSRSRSRSKSESRSVSPPTSPKHKRHKKRSSKEKYRTKSKSRSSSPSSKHKKKKYHHKSRSKDNNNDYAYDPRYKNVLV